MTQSRADFIELLCKLIGQSLGSGETAFEDPVGDVSIAQSHDRRAEDGHSRGRQDEPSGERALANAAHRPIVVRIDGMTLVTRGLWRAASTSEIVPPIDMPTIVACLISILSRYTAVHW